MPSWDRWRRYLPAVTLGACALVGPATAQTHDATDVAGRWLGAIVLPNVELEISVVFAAAAADAGWSGAIDIPMQNARDLPLENVTVADGKVAFDLPSNLGRARFEGDVGPGGDVITGKFAQAGKTYPFRLTRQADLPPPDPAALSTGAGAALAAAQVPMPMGPYAAELEGLDDLIAESLPRWGVPGLALAIVTPDEVIMAEGYGFRNVALETPVTRQTLFAIGSSTKSFTAFAMGTLVEEGLLEWDEPVIDYVPTFRMHDPVATAGMTPRDLLTHRSGLPRHDLMWYNSPLTRVEIFDRLRYLEPNKGFRDVFQYQNLMYMAAGYVAGQVAGTTWEELVRSRIFEPLGMTSSNFSVLESQQRDDHARPYDERDEEIVEIPFRDITTIGPAGSINSNLDDMIRWAQLHLGGGEMEGRRLVSDALLRELHTPVMALRVLSDDPESPIASYALGWFVQPYRGHLRIHHGGNIDGFSALVTLLPQEELGVVVLTNRNATPFPGVVTRHVVDRLLDLDRIDWNERGLTELGEAQDVARRAKEADDPSRREKTTPSHDLEEYAGVYNHPAYGSFSVTEHDNRLHAAYNGMTIELEHWHYDVFRGSNPHEPGLDDLKISFMSGVSGEVDRLAVVLETSVAEIVFRRQPPSLADDPELVQALIGSYRVAGQTVEVGLKGGSTLTLTVPGQPTYELEPYREHEFQLKGLTGYRVRFDVNGDGKVTSFLLFQPNGIYTAERE